MDDEGTVTYMETNGDFNTSIRLDIQGDVYLAIRKDLNEGNNDILVSVCFSMGHSQILSHRKE
jgi:uncharacterized protein YciU (UPF0263 family)